MVDNRKIINNQEMINKSCKKNVALAILSLFMAG